MLGKAWTTRCDLRIFPSAWNTTDGRDLFCRGLHNDIRVRLDVVLTARPGPRGRPGHTAAREPVHGRALAASSGGLSPKVVIYDVRARLHRVPLPAECRGPLVDGWCWRCDGQAG